MSVLISVSETVRFFSTVSMIHASRSKRKVEQKAFCVWSMINQEVIALTSVDVASSSNDNVT